jgi:hypothetical protein
MQVAVGRQLTARTCKYVINKSFHSAASVSSIPRLSITSSPRRHFSLFAVPTPPPLSSNGTTPSTSHVYDEHKEHNRVLVRAPGAPDQPLPESNISVDSYFGSLVFNRRTMKEYLSAVEYEKFAAALSAHKQIDFATADAIAKALLKWATERGATHYTHWFQVCSREMHSNCCIQMKPIRVQCIHFVPFTFCLCCASVCIIYSLSLVHVQRNMILSLIRESTQQQKHTYTF